MIKLLKASTEATFEVTGITFFKLYNSYRAITETAVIVFDKGLTTGIAVYERSLAPAVYAHQIESCANSGTEITMQEWVAGVKEVTAKYAAQINYLLEAEVATQIFCL